MDRFTAYDLCAECQSLGCRVNSHRCSGCATRCYLPPAALRPRPTALAEPLAEWLEGIDIESL
jgi:hypothetical protein